MRKSIALVTLLVAVALAAWWLRAPQAPPPAAGEPAIAKSEARTGRSAERDARRATPAPAIANAPLPPENVPLRDAFAQLDAQARAGNAQAACRMAAELRRCDTLSELVDRAEPVDETVARLQASQRYTPAELQRRIGEVRRVDAGLQGVAAHCAQWSELPNQRHYLLIAARRGHAESIYRYVGMPLSGGDVLRDPQLAIDYRANALPLFQRGLEAGDVRLLGPWVAAVAAPAQSPLSAVLPPEWRNRGMLKELHALAAARFGDFATRGGFTEPDRIASTDADRAEAQRLFDRYFRDSSPPDDHVPAMLFDGLDPAYLGCDQIAP